jgi:transposase
METLVARCAGLDMHKDSVTACVRVPDGHGGRQVETRRFTTTTAGLVLLAQWLASFGVTRVGMESTGVLRRRSWRSSSSWLVVSSPGSPWPWSIRSRLTQLRSVSWLSPSSGRPG